MNNKEMKEFVETLYPYFLDLLKQDGFFKNIVKMKNATVVSIPDHTDSEGNLVSNIDKKVSIQLPYDSKSFEALNHTGKELAIGETVSFLSWIDLKNAVVMFKN